MFAWYIHYTFWCYPFIPTQKRARRYAARASIHHCAKWFAWNMRILNYHLFEGFISTIKTTQWLPFDICHCGSCKQQENCSIPRSLWRHWIPFDFCFNLHFKLKQMCEHGILRREKKMVQSRLGKETRFLHYSQVHRWGWESWICKSVRLCRMCGTYYIIYVGMGRTRFMCELYLEYLELRNVVYNWEECVLVTYWFIYRRINAVGIKLPFAFCLK